MSRSIHTILKRSHFTLALGAAALLATSGCIQPQPIGFEFGDLAIDGMLEKNFLRDGPHFIGGSSRGGGLLTTLSILPATPAAFR